LNRIFDLHAHPSLKMHYIPWFTRTLHALAYSGDHFNPFSFRTRYANLKDSPVKVIVNAHYPIEQAFLRDFKTSFKAFAWIAGPVYYGWLRFADPWKTLNRMIRLLDDAENETNRWVFGKNEKHVKVCRRFSDITGLEENEIGFIHAMESSHPLGVPSKGQGRDEFWEQTCGRLQSLKDRGVAMITLAHFYDNAFMPQVDGMEIVAGMRGGRLVTMRDGAIHRMQTSQWKWGDKDHFAEELVRELFRIGIVVDVTHSQEHARNKVYDIAEECDRPVVMSHVGLQHFYKNKYNATDKEILRIHELGGVIGLIFSRRWLVDPIDRYYSGNEGIHDLIENMLYMRDLCGDVNVIGIGTDFDGMTHPFADCFKPDQLDRIVHAMSRHFDEDEIDRILYGNSLRVFEKGWD